MRRFYGHFAAAYGTIWLVLLVVAVLSHDHINAGAFGLFGFPLIAFIYAAYRTSSEPDFRKDHARLTWENGELRGRLHWLERHHSQD